MPKGPPTPYALFVKAYFNREKDNLHSSADGGKIRISEVSRVIADQWKSLPSSERSGYESTARQLRSSYETESREFFAGLSPSEREAVEAKSKKLRVPKVLKDKDTTAPAARKKPLSAFFEFLAEMRETGGIDVSGEETGKRPTAFSKKGGMMWKAMSDAERQVRRDTSNVTGLGCVCDG